MSERFRLRATGLEWRTVDEEIAALDLPAETYLGVNRSGSLLWRALAQGAIQEDLVQLLVDEYGLAPADAERDVGEFIAALRAQHVLESEPG